MRLGLRITTKRHGFSQYMKHIILLLFSAAIFCAEPLDEAVAMAKEQKYDELQVFSTAYLDAHSKDVPTSELLIDKPSKAKFSTYYCLWMYRVITLARNDSKAGIDDQRLLLKSLRGGYEGTESGKAILVLVASTLGSYWDNNQERENAVETYQLMYENEGKWSAKPLYTGFLYGCALNELKKYPEARKVFLDFIGRREQLIKDKKYSILAGAMLSIIECYEGDAANQRKYAKAGLALAQQYNLEKLIPAFQAQVDSLK